MNPPKIILPIIVIAQFCCTSLWFAGNGVMGDLVSNFQLDTFALGHLTSAVQFGFISGTLIFAILTIADRYSPSKVFFICALLGATANLGVIWESNNYFTLIILRLLTGFFLAGIYPVGMKIAADYFDKGLGKSLGFLVGALVLGTAFPHLLKDLTNQLPWKSVLITTSSLATMGGLMLVLLVPDGPHRKKSQQMNFSAFFNVFKKPTFRSAAFGYFGHMWELYAFWTCVPIILASYNQLHNTTINVPLFAFLIIGMGSLACVIGGYLAQSFGAKRIATIALALSCTCCLISPMFLILENHYIVLGFLFFWGLAVIADSPLFSTLVAQIANPEIKGTALTIVNSIGFAITIISIQLITYLQSYNANFVIYTILALGPILGLIALSRPRNVQ